MTIRLTGVIALIAVLIVTFIQSGEIMKAQQNQRETSIQENPSSETSNNGNQQDSNSIVQGLSGIYPGTSKLFGESFDFPESTLELRQDGSFIISAAGFETVDLNIQEFQIDGQYPFVVVQAYGYLKQDTDRIIADVQGIEVSFTKNINGETVVLNEEENIRMLNILESNEILIPSPSSSNPLIVPLAYDTVPSVTLKSLEGSPVFVSFGGYGENQVRSGLIQQNQN